MKKTWRIVIIVIIGLVIIIQFFQPEKNDKLANPQDDIVFQLDIPAPVRETLVNSCYDCHSNRTNYPFYNRIAPVSWLLAKHIRDGKAHLNFSEWANYDRKEQIKRLTEICDMIVEGEMPLKSYLLMHKKAALDELQIEEICMWGDEAVELLINPNE